MSADTRPKMQLSQRVYGEIVYWGTIVACIICMIGPYISMKNPDKNVMNPFYLFAAIFEGKDTATIWQEVAGGFPGGHFYLEKFFYGDGFTQFGLAMGCSVAAWALIPAALIYLFKEKNPTYTILCLWVAALIFLSMIGIVKS
ncbi:MAG: hypothetical protein AVO38_07255 [delta proteobacterium ML8_D]|nr:MAG: hypothetical protein AVO38_07255 [delta proteobacterium ML8_D]